MSRARVSLLGQSKRDHVDFSIPLTSGLGVSVSDEVARLASALCCVASKGTRIDKNPEIRHPMPSCWALMVFRVKCRWRTRATLSG